MEYCRVQIGCLLIVTYIVFIYYRECKKYHKRLSTSIFDELMILGIVSIALDGITAVTVNYLDEVNIILNKALHLLFLLSIDTVIYMMFGYMIRTTGVLPQNKGKRMLLHIPYLVNVLIVVLNIGSLEFREGRFTNYSMGISAYSCFIMVGIYVLFSLILFFKCWDYIESNKRISIC